MSQLTATNRYKMIDNTDTLGVTNLQNEGLGPIDPNASDELSRVNQAFEYDGDTTLDDYTEQTGRVITRTFSYETRMQWKDSTTTTVMATGYRKSTNPLTWMFLYIMPNNDATNPSSIRLRIRNASGGADVSRYTSSNLTSAPFNFTDGTWFTLTYAQERLNSSNHAHCKVWINGVLEMDETITSNVVANTTNRMGWGGAGDVRAALNYDKKISLSNIYNDRLLTDMVVMQNHNRMKLSGGF